MRNQYESIVRDGVLGSGLSESDFAYDDPYLSRQRAVATFPFLARRASSRDFTQPEVIETVGEHTIAFIAGDADKYIVPQADFIVALGTPDDAKQIDIVIRPDEIETTVAEAGTVYVGCKSEGKRWGVGHFGWIRTAN